MRKIQLSVLLIALCLLFATYAASAKEAIAGKQGRRYLCIKNRPGFSKLPKTLSDAEDPWRTIYNPNPRPYLLSDAEAEKINWSKIGKKLAGIGQAAGHLGAIKNLILSEADAEFGVPSWAQPTPYNPNPRPGGFMNDYDVEEFADEEEFDEEDFSINGNIANGGRWSVGGGYNTKIGRGDLSIGGSISNGRNYNVGATFKMPF